MAALIQSLDLRPHDFLEPVQCKNGDRRPPVHEAMRDLQEPRRAEANRERTVAHKIREALAAEKKGETVSSTVAVDGAYFGGYVKPSNYKENRRDRRFAVNQNGKRRVVVIAREYGGKTLPFVFKSEAASLPTLSQIILPGSTIHADEATHWDALHGKFLTRRVNHEWAYSDDGACTNQAESFFSRIRRAEIGIHHRIAGAYLSAYAAEMAWHEDNRRISNGEQYLMAVNAALAHPVSRQWKGYWQRAA